MQNLYAINSMLRTAINDAEQEAIDNNGILSDALSDRIDSLELDRTEVIGGICKHIKNLHAEEGMIKAEIARLKERADNIHRKALSAEKALSTTLVNSGEEYADSVSRVSWRKSSGITILDEDKIPDEYFKIEKKPILSDIKKAIKRDIKVPGAIMYTRLNMKVV